VRKGEEEAKSEGVERVVCVPDGVPRRSEMAPEQHPLSITGKYSTLFTVCLLLFSGY